MITRRDVELLGEVLAVAREQVKVRWSEDDGETIRTGVARHIVKSPDSIGFLGPDEDLRNGFLRITTVTGLETFLPVPKVALLIREGMFARG